MSDSDADPREKTLVSLLKKVENLERKIKKIESDSKNKSLKQ